MVTESRYSSSWKDQIKFYGIAVRFNALALIPSQARRTSTAGLCKFARLEVSGRPRKAWGRNHGGSGGWPVGGWERRSCQSWSRSGQSPSLSRNIVCHIPHAPRTSCCRYTLQTGIWWRSCSLGHQSRPLPCFWMCLQSKRIFYIGMFLELAERKSLSKSTLRKNLWAIQNEKRSFAFTWQKGFFSPRKESKYLLEKGQKEGQEFKKASRCQQAKAKASAQRWPS